MRIPFEGIGYAGEHIGLLDCRVVRQMPRQPLLPIMPASAETALKRQQVKASAGAGRILAGRCRATVMVNANRQQPL
jgi:hypothetical protein